MTELVDTENIKEYQQKNGINNITHLATASLYDSSIKKVCRNPNIRMSHAFSNTLGIDIEQVDQMKTGTCWLQAALTKLSFMSRIQYVNNEKKTYLRFSVWYLMFFDKIEKSAVFLTRCLQKRNEDDRELYHLLQEPIADGGDWPMFCHLINKYGIVPFDTYPLSYQAKNSSQLNTVINQYLRRVCRNVNESNIRSHIDKIHDILLRCLSIPPHSLNLNEEENGLSFEGSPLEFWQLIKKYTRIDDYICLQDAPTKNLHAFYTSWYSNNCANLKQHTFFTVQMSELKDACARCIENKIPVWFTSGTRGGADFSRKLLKDRALDYETLFSIDIDDGMTKSDLMRCRYTKPTHAMLLIGFHRNTKGQIVRWKVQNSWKKSGILSMCDDWFSKNVFEIAIPSNIYHLPPPTKVTVLEPWDILSTVAN